MKEERINHESTLKTLINDNERYKIDLKDIVDLK